MTNDTTNDKTNDKTGLDGFDRALLAELRQVAAAGMPAPRRTHRRLAMAGTGIAALAATVAGVTTLGSSPAYAVSENGEGDVVITIRELEDEPGLEQALADHGIEADVDYDAAHDAADGADGAASDLPALPGKADGGTVVHGEGSADAGPSTDSSGPPAAGDPCGGPDTMPFTTDLSEDAYTITIPSDSVLLDQDAALQITTTGDIADQLAGLEVAFSVGGVSCGFGTMSAAAPGVR